MVFFLNIKFKVYVPVDWAHMALADLVEGIGAAPIVRGHSLVLQDPEGQAVVVRYSMAARLVEVDIVRGYTLLFAHPGCFASHLLNTLMLHIHRIYFILLYMLTICLCPRAIRRWRIRLWFFSKVWMSPRLLRLKHKHSNKYDGSQTWYSGNV